MKKKYLFYSDKVIGSGAAIACSRLANYFYLHSNSCDVTYLSPGTGGKDYKGAFSFVDVLSTYKIRPLSSKLKTRLLKILCLSKLLEKALIESEVKVILNEVKNKRYDALFLHNNSFSYSQINEIGKHVKVYWTMHDFSPLLGYNYKIKCINGKSHIYGPRVRDLDDRSKVLSNPNIKFISPSVWLKETTVNRDSKIDESKIIVINNYLERQKVHFNKEVCRSMYGIPKDKFVLFFLQGSYSFERKNFDLIDRALKDVGEDVCFVVVGANITRNAYLDERVISMPSSNDRDYINRLFSLSDAFCIPSIEDNYPNTVLEALSNSVPVLGANAGGIPEMIEEGKTGYLFDPYNPEDFTSKLYLLMQEKDKLVVNPKVIKQLSSAGMVRDYEAIIGEGR